MERFLTLTWFRRVVQLFMFVIMVYGALFMTTFYSEDKFTGALPALSCAYDKQSGDYCSLIPVQHQMDHRVSMAFTSDSVSIMQAVMPTLITIGTFIILVVILNKAFCGWVCPLGFFQEMIHALGDKLGFKRFHTLSTKTLKKVRPIKWFMLAFLVFIFPLLTGIGWLGHEFGDGFCRICPSRILTTLAVGDTSQLYIDNSSIGYMIFSIIADLLFGLMIAMALVIKQPFCRICPMLAFQAVFKKLGLLKLVKNGSSSCEKCGLCAKVCPTDIIEIQNPTTKLTDITFADCTLCGACVEFCPDDDVMRLQYAGFPIFKSSKAYFKKRNKDQRNWEKVVWADVAPK
jgi:formate hydrogenlyase subunit 6/NADH:ubiquinone oxidoreductase subunit I